MYTLSEYLPSYANAYARLCACVWIVSCVFFINRVAIMTMSDVFSRKFFLPAKYANMAVRTTDTNIKAMLKHFQEHRC